MSDSSNHIADMRMATYETLLRKWQTRINLVANSTLDDTRNRHFNDSLQILPMIPAQARTLYDLGSGGGFPGLVLAIKRPDLSIHLIESNTKKTNFLQTVARELELDNVSIHNTRIEEMTAELPSPDVITARALASLVNIFELTAQWAKANDNLRYILMKGRNAKQEICDAQKKFRFEHHTAPSSTDPEAAILRIQNVHKK